MNTMNSFNTSKIASVVSRCVLITMVAATFASFTSVKASANVGVTVRADVSVEIFCGGGKDGQETHG